MHSGCPRSALPSQTGTGCTHVSVSGRPQLQGGGAPRAKVRAGRLRPESPWTSDVQLACCTNGQAGQRLHRGGGVHGHLRRPAPTGRPRLGLGGWAGAEMAGGGRPERSLVITPHISPLVTRFPQALCPSTAPGAAPHIRGSPSPAEPVQGQGWASCPASLRGPDPHLQGESPESTRKRLCPRGASSSRPCGGKEGRPWRAEAGGSLQGRAGRVCPLTLTAAVSALRVRGGLGAPARTPGPARKTCSWLRPLGRGSPWDWGRAHSQSREAPQGRQHRAELG